ncbi:MAG: hypothetical protein JWL86_1947 [Rhizobium sp.]|nr:hypothetical protein [Rhizobium sp.]
MTMRSALLLATLAICLLAHDAFAETLALQVESAEVVSDQATGAPVLMVKLKPESATAFGTFTKAHVGKQVRVRSGNTVLSEPFIVEPILGGAIMISGNFTPQSAKDLATILESDESALTVEGATE